MGFVDFKTWTADYCDRVYRAIGREVGIVILCDWCNGTYSVVWSMGAVWNQKS